MRPEVKQYAVQVAAVRDRWLKIHDELFATPWWRSLRRVIRIPGIFVAIPYKTQAIELQAQLNELDDLGNTLVRICESEDADDEAKALSAATVMFIESLLPVISILHDINQVMADNIDRGTTNYTLQDYNRDVEQYELARSRFQAAIPAIGRLLAEREAS